MINLEQCDFIMHVQFAYNGLIAHLVNILFQKPYFEILSDQLASIQMMRVCNFFYDRNCSYSLIKCHIFFSTATFRVTQVHCCCSIVFIVL